MAEVLVGGALLSGFINVVFERLLSPEAVNLIKGKKLDPELVGRLKTALYAAEALLIDAEYQQFNKEPVRKWLDSLKNAVYKADDSLDHVFTIAATQKKVRVSWPRILNFKERRMVSKMVNKIEVDVRRIEDILKFNVVSDLRVVASDNNYSSWRTPATCLVKGKMFGREDDKQAIMKIINDESDQKLCVIPIVGMGGIGKTTLAQWLYNNEDLKMKGFDLKEWVCVSEEFDIVKVTQTILGGATLTTDLNLLQLELKQKLSTKKFFIVLDDVWSDDRDIWNNFKAPFLYGAKGSTVLITTRSKDVASVVQTCAPFFLNELSDDYCWSVFAENACFPESNGNSALEEVGRKIVKKCHGLPLAAETLGGLLRTEHDIEKWNSVLMSDVWDFPVNKSKIIPALLISYYHLPAHLKGCFVYCSLFPKDHKFVKDDLILLWMAEDLLRPPRRGETLEEVGNECFDNLASRLFFKQHGNWNGDEYFVMHDLLHDLSMFLAGDFYCRLEELGKAEKMSIQTRHLSYGSLSHPISKNFDSIDKVESLRTFLQVNFSRPSFSIERTSQIVFSKLNYLRVLSFRSFEVLDLLPDSIGKLIHLRYLDLSYTSIKTLPESLCDLYNLQTLKLRGCYELTMLPNDMHNLLNLRHLDIRCTRLQEMPRGIGELKHLHFLGRFAVGREKDSAGIKELGELSNLAGTLELKNLENVANCEEAMGARLMDKTHVNKLILEWCSGGDIVSEMQTERDILDKLQPHYGLKELGINGYWATRFPNWVGHSSYHNITRVSLKYCTSCRMLPSLGKLPSLKSLEIENFEKLDKIGVEFYKNEDDPSSSSSAASPSFPSLQDLTFRSMPCWEMWSPFESDNDFPQLKSLKIIDCRRLKGDLPNHLPALEKLQLDHCCNSLTLLQLEAFPELKELRIRGCENLESFSLSESQSQHMNRFEVRECKRLKSLPTHMNTLLPNLEYIFIRDCADIDSFPEGGLPPNLKTLEVENCEKLLSNLSSMGMLESLTHLYIGGRDCSSILSFPNEGLLPGLPSLTTMLLTGFPNMETLECKELLLRLTSLQQLDIVDCPKLENIAGERLPHALLQLRIYRCPLLAELCKKKHDQIWPKISHIRSIEVDDRWVS